MAPKTPKSEGRAADDGANIIALCHLIMACEDFHADNATLAPILNLAQAKNVPRKINTIVGPYGFEFKGGKIIKKGDGGADGPSEPATPAAAPSGEQIAVAVTPPAKKKSKKPAATPTKKRKLDEAVAVAADDDLDEYEV
ncbi:hypothetical protein TruAng_011010 [Truncatella angustata]|nr:hypothetical protein TruAng_011010 [Truncatella angustata]